MSEQAAVTPFDLRIHFEGAFVFSLQTANNASSDTTPLTGVQVYAPTCEHLHAATVNKGSMYMLENYWHCIDPVYEAGTTATPITLGDVKKKLSSNTPMVPGNRPVGSGWTLAVNLPIPPNDWESDLEVSTTDPDSKQPCFSGMSANIIPASVATEQIVIYKQITSVAFHGACFAPNFTPVNGVVDLVISSEMPDVIPTIPHQSRAISAMASLLGIDLVFQHPLPKGDGTAGTFQPRTVHTGGCSMPILSGPGL
jgi:hypothetical protein